MRIIFIASLDHSGSTILEAFLSSFDNCLGIGEAYKMFSYILSPQYRPQNFSHRQCSCGNKAGECPFWKDIIDYVASHHITEISECYEIVHRQAEKLMGSKVQLIDSSKYLPALSFLSKNSSFDINLSVIHLARDIRSWTSNRRRRYLLEDTTNFSLKRRIKAGPTFLFRTWLQFNKKMETLITQNNLNSINLGYEEFCLSFNKAGRWLSSEYSLSVQDDLGMYMHNIFGNVVRGNDIHYDYRWLMDDSWKIPMILIPSSSKANRRFVYSNNFLE